MTARYFFMEEIMEQKTDQLLGEEHISKLMMKYAIPCIISLLVGALYNLSLIHI